MGIVLGRILLQKTYTAGVLESGKMPMHAHEVSELSECMYNYPQSICFYACLMLFHFFANLGDGVAIARDHTSKLYMYLAVTFHIVQQQYNPFCSQHSS
jgi:hypothetical protein